MDFRNFNMDIKSKDIRIMTIRVEEVYQLTNPGTGLGLKEIRDVELEGVWLRCEKHPHLVSCNHSMYKDQFGTWWFYHDGKLTRFPKVVETKFRDHYNPSEMPYESNHLTSFNAEVDVMITAEF